MSSWEEASRDGPLGQLGAQMISLSICGTSMFEHQHVYVNTAVSVCQLRFTQLSGMLGT